MTKKYSCEVKLPGHPVKTGQALNLAWYRAGTPGLPGKVVSFYIVPLPAGRQGPRLSRQRRDGARSGHRKILFDKGQSA